MEDLYCVFLAGSAAVAALCKGLRFRQPIIFKASPLPESGPITDFII